MTNRKGKIQKVQLAKHIQRAIVRNQNCWQNYSKPGCKIVTVKQEKTVHLSLNMNTVKNRK